VKVRDSDRVRYIPIVFLFEGMGYVRPLEADDQLDVVGAPPTHLMHASPEMRTSMSTPGVDRDGTDEEDSDLDERAEDVLDGEFVTFDEHDQRRE